MPSLSELQSYLTIDKHQLDDAITHHAELLFTVSNALAHEVNERDLLKKELEEQYAATTLKMRDLAIKSGIKTTEDQIKQSALLDEEYKEAQVRFLNKKLHCDRLQAMKEAFIARGYMIRDLAELWIAGYFSDMTIKATEQTADDLRAQLARQAMTEKRKSRT